MLSGKNQNLVVAGDAVDSKQFHVTCSEDTAKLEAYERFRKESLNRLVVSVRNRIKKLIDGLGKVVAKNLHGYNLKEKLVKLFSK